MRKRLVALMIGTCITMMTAAQNSVGIGTTTPESSAALDISSTNKGLLIPRITSAQRLSLPSPAKGLMVFDTNSNSFWYYEGQSSWREIGGNKYKADSALIVGHPAGPSVNLNGNITLTTLSGTLYDSGGPLGNYTNNEDFTATLSSYPATEITVLSNSLESPYDSLIISDAYGRRHVLLGNATGSYRLFGTVKIQFKSNFTNTQTGFAVRWEKISYDPNEDQYDPKQLVGWYFNPAKFYFRAGVNINNYWHPDSSGFGSMVLGSGSIAKGGAGVAIGDNNWANGSTAPVAIGIANRALGSWSVALGTLNSTHDTYAAAIGYENHANEYGSVAIGLYNTANNTYAHSIGNFNQVNGANARAFGTGLKVKPYGGTVIGMYNDSTNAASEGSYNALNRIFQIGNGTSEFNRSNAMTILQNGNVGIGMLVPTSKINIAKTGLYTNQENQGHAIEIMDTSTATNHYLYIGADATNQLSYIQSVAAGSFRALVLQGRGGFVGIGTATTTDMLTVGGTVRANTSVLSDVDVIVDFPGENNGTPNSGLRFGGYSSGEAISSKRTTTGNQYGLDFYTAGNNRMNISNGGTVNVVNNLTVQNGKGIIRSADGTQQKKLTRDVLVNTTIAAGATTSISFTFPESFSGIPDVYIAQSGGVGGWAEVVMSMGNPTTGGGTLYIFNPKGVSVSPNFTVRIVAIGAQ